MVKIKTKFICQECGYETPKWLGKCPSCGQWNTFVEEFYEKSSQSRILEVSTSKAQKLKEVELKNEVRVSTCIKEFDRVLGGGIVKGSLILVGGDPGIGKSTLLIQAANNISIKGHKVLYVSGEESAKQIKIRASRLGISAEDLFVLAETNIEKILSVIKDIQPQILIIDSIQTVYTPSISSAPGSVSQVREISSMLMKIAKEREIATFIVGHVTKSGAIAGPRVLEHMVDTVLYFEGERHHTYRVLRAVKNRFGSTNEIGIFEMRDLGLVEVTNPSEMLLSGRPVNASGNVVISSIEGTRPMLIEMQALVSYTAFGMPRRIATGVDYNRVILMIAILEKKIGLQLNNMDAYVNVTGGIQIKEPAADLGIICALASSFRDVEIDSKTVVMGEVGLAGELRSISFIDKRINEASKLGFKTAIIPESNLKGLNIKTDMNIIGASNIRDVLDICLGG
ncbi:DNA repair protein RadA/Sms [Caloranaerobacter azorensis DSM 13643]|uniref:DNA repair protein RadA n=1 Tax=Caloranaerobacter azorensis DSM 13643 TaxID=1121264 RepID=A0A1M5VJK0_9FIRM|nr:DNA repair protein RadA [Caloranaerobacter azorensis]SHH75368.1 DNA repair protein RadA/Sms [Caloranaerobacter azorensis DSM 13643]